jgi:hypothetical protein
MPLTIAAGAPTLVIRREVYERTNLARSAIDTRLGLTADEFRVEGDLIAIGPVFDTEAFAGLLEELETLGLNYYDDFFELSGNWPAWISVLAGAVGATGRSNPSQPHA